ncbi:hypothetical protein GGR69_001471 [Xanthomonas arboricola]|nr:hypothetical protein [Xanthomonas arboricola]
MVGGRDRSRAGALSQWTHASAGGCAVADPDQPGRCACLQSGSAAGLVVPHAVSGRGVAARTTTRTRPGRQCGCAHAGSAAVPDPGCLCRVRAHACRVDRWQRRCAGTRECVDRVRGAAASACGADQSCACGRYRADAAGGRVSADPSCTCGLAARAVHAGGDAGAALDSRLPSGARADPACVSAGLPFPACARGLAARR